MMIIIEQEHNSVYKAIVTRGHASGKISSDDILAIESDCFFLRVDPDI
jgi:hypothetical protein